MTDSAVDRASVAIANALGIPSCSTEAARRIAETLLGRPSLLVDLALEAGGLEQCGWRCDEPELLFVLAGDPDDDEANPNLEPVYRRKEKNSGS